MRCMACGSEGAPGAKFCAACGKAMAPEAPAPGPGPGASSGSSPHQPVNVQVHFNMGGPGGVHLPTPYPNGGQAQGLGGQGHGGQMMPAGPMGMMPFGQHQHGWQGRRGGGRFCEVCQQRTTPVPYFSRGVNVAKAVVLFPFTSFVGPLIFFLIKRNKVICAHCQSKLPGEVSVPLLDSFSPDAVGALGPMEPGEDLVPVNRAVGQQIAVLERSSRKQRRRSWTLGVLAAGMATIGGSNALDGDGEAALVLFGISGVAGAGALVSRQRGQQNSVLAAASRQRQRVLEVLGLARAHAGRLNVTMVASQLHLDFKEAEALMDGMVDGRRVDVEVDDQGRMSYVFPELKP